MRQNSAEKSLSTCAVNIFGLTAIPTVLSLINTSRNFLWTSEQVTFMDMGSDMVDNNLESPCISLLWKLWKCSTRDNRFYCTNEYILLHDLYNAQVHAHTYVKVNNQMAPFLSILAASSLPCQYNPTCGNQALILALHGKRASSLVNQYHIIRWEEGNCHCHTYTFI